MKKTNRNAKMKKWAAIVSVAVVMTVLFTGCSSMKLADSFDEGAVKAKAQEVVDLMSSEDYDGVYALFDAKMKEALTAEALRQNMEANFSGLGAYKQVKSMALVGQKTKDTKEDTAVAVAVVEYENRNVTYTINFNTNMEVMGLYAK